MRSLFRLLPASLVLSLGVLFTAPVVAAENIVLKFSVFRDSLSVRELQTFAETGEPSTQLKAYLALTKQDPDAIRQTLNKPVKVNPLILDQVLNSPVGNLLLDELSQVIHTPSNQANHQALRSAMILSASDDRQITLMELMTHYPTPEVHVEGDRLLEAYQTLSRLKGRVRDILESLPF